jgi:hypothetical protein
VQQVEQKRGLLDRVGALDYHGANRARRQLLSDRPRQVEDVTDDQGRSWHPPEVVHLDAGAEAGQARYRGQELLPGQRGDHPAGLARRPGHQYS